MENLFADLPGNLEDELFSALVESSHVRIERIVSTGQESPTDFWYDQEEHEWVALLQGRARLQFEDGRVETLGPGDHLLIPAHTRHRVASTADDEVTIWLAVFFRESFH